MKARKTWKESEAHWDAVWERLRAEGRVAVTPDPKPPYCPSSCAALAEYSANPGVRTNVRPVLQTRYGSSSHFRGAE